MADSLPADHASRRAERARRNGALSRGPATARGKQRSSRNALRHGLTAKVHLVLHRDDEADFTALARGLGDELAPRGALEGFLVARLTAAMWHSGRAERMEARAFAAAPDPDPDRLRLALRYRGSVQRELFRCLGALQDLRRRPLELPTECTEPPAADAADPSAGVSTISALPPADLARIAVAAWGGERADAIPPGFLELRPVRNVWPIGWRFVQDRAFPGDVPLLVYADGTVRSPEGTLLDDVWSPGGPLPPRPYTPAPPLPAPVPPQPSPVMSAPVPTAPLPEPEPEPEPSALDWLDGEDDELDAFDLLDDLPTYRRLRNEPIQSIDSARFLAVPQPLDADTLTPRIGLGRTPPDLSVVPPDPDAVVEPEELSPPIGHLPERPDHQGPPPPALLPDKRAKMVAWERMWGIKLPDGEFREACDDTSEPEAPQPREQICSNELPACTAGPGTGNAHPCGTEGNAAVEDCTSRTPIETVQCPDDRQPDPRPSAVASWRRRSGLHGRIRRRRSGAPALGPPE